MQHELNRRAFARSLVAIPAMGLLGAPGLAKAAGGAGSAKPRKIYDVAKVMSFACSFCLASESQDRAIEQAVKRQGGRFVRAPIAETAGAQGHRERVYYAARDLDADFGEKVKSSLYRGTQEAQVTLEMYAQVYHWLMQDMPDEEVRIYKAIEAAQQSAAGAALQRAAALTISAGVARLPTYVVLNGSSIVAAMDSSTTGATSMSALREAVLAKISES